MVWRGKKNDNHVYWFTTKNEATKECAVVFGQVRVVLTIAHLDHDETNHDVKDERLMAMCQLCHLRYDAKEKYRRVMNKPPKD